MNQDHQKVNQTTTLNHSSLTQAFHLACQVAKDVGVLLKSYLEDPDYHPRRSEADLIAEQHIRQVLTTSFPNWGFRAEEEPEKNAVSDPNTPFWLVDPNDGTSAFLKGERGASIAIALIYQSRPVLGVVHAYAAPNGLGDLFAWAKGVSPLMRNGQEVHPQWATSWSKSTIFVSNSADRISEAYKKALSSSGSDQVQYRIAPGIAYRLALCAVGEAELAISLASPRDFDFAAGHALLIGAGGSLVDERGSEVSYVHHRPFRLGFAFGGQTQLAKQAVELEWQHTFSAQRQKKGTTPFLAAQDVQLCTQAKLLDHLQGAWWGWHIGYQTSRMKGGVTKADLIELGRQFGGDHQLVYALRQYLKGSEALSDEASEYLRLFISNLQSCNPNASKPLTLNEVHNAQTGLLWGLSTGRRQLPSRIVSSFLGWRQGKMNHWQPDGDRLMEQLLSKHTELYEALSKEYK